jgi:hypothetical protein
MTKEFMKTAKELAWKAYLDAFKHIGTVTDDAIPNIRERFENWWSDNYGNRDSTKFYAEHNVYVEGKKYIQAE